MPRITLSARFDNLQNAERAATEVRSLLGTDVDIRRLSENQSDTKNDNLNFPTFFVFPNMNFTSTPYGGAFPAGSINGFEEEIEGGGVYSDQAYVMEAQIDADDEQRAAEIIEKYGAELV